MPAMCNEPSCLNEFSLRALILWANLSMLVLFIDLRCEHLFYALNLAACALWCTWCKSHNMHSIDSAWINTHTQTHTHTETHTHTHTRTRSRETHRHIRIFTAFKKLLIDLLTQFFFRKIRAVSNWLLLLQPFISLGKRLGTHNTQISSWFKINTCLVKFQLFDGHHLNDVFLF